MSFYAESEEAAACKARIYWEHRNRRSNGNLGDESFFLAFIPCQSLRCGVNAWRISFAFCFSYDGENVAIIVARIALL